MASEDPQNPLLEELADARVRLAALEQQVEKQAAATVSAEDREEAERHAAGVAVLGAIQAARGRSEAQSEALLGQTFGAGQGRS